MLDTSKVLVRSVLVLMGMVFFAVPCIMQSQSSTTIEITNGCPTSPPYFGSVTFHFDNFPNQNYSSFAAGSTILTVPEIPNSMTISGSTVFVGGSATFQDAGQTGYMLVDHQGILWHYEL